MNDHALCRHELELAITRGGGGADAIPLSEYQGPLEGDGILRAKCPHGSTFMVIASDKGAS